MIIGVHCDIQTEEMGQLIEKQIAYHLEKVTFYGNTAKELEANGMKRGAGSRDALGDIEDKVREHERQRDRLMFIRDHLVPGETYRLSDSDMSSLGFVKGRY